MEKKIILTNTAPLPVGPYNQAVAAGGFLFVSGQIPTDPTTNQVVSGAVTEQARMVLNNLSAVLIAAGSSLSQVVKITVFLKNMEDFSAMNAVYEKFFQKTSAPARSTIEVARLPKDVLVEIEAIALV